MNKINIRTGNCLDILPTMEAGSVNCCVTSPPYFGLRDYGNDEQIGLEETPEAFVESLVNVFREVKRVLADDGTLWLNLGDSYARQAGNEESKLKTLHTMGVGQKKAHEAGAMRKGKNRPPKGLKPKDLIGIPWRVALALQADGWYLRQDIIWSKPNPMPESVTDRCTKAHEYIFLLSKSPKYFYDAEAIKEEAQNWGERDRSNMRDGTTDPKLKHHGLKGKQNEAEPTRNKRSVWEVTTKPYSGAHFATFPPDLIKPCIMQAVQQAARCLIHSEAVARLAWWLLSLDAVLS